MKGNSVAALTGTFVCNFSHLKKLSLLGSNSTLLGKDDWEAKFEHF